MGILEGYDMCGKIKEKPFLTLRTHTITFSKASIDLLGNPEYVHAYVDLKNKKYAIQSCKKEAFAFPFYTEPKEGKQLLIRWANKERVSDLTQMIDISKFDKGVRIYGEYHEDENIIVYNLNNYVEI